MTTTTTRTRFSDADVGRRFSPSSWVLIDQDMIDMFGRATLDPDPMHIAPDWAREHSPFGTTISFGFLTASLLSHLLHSALGTDASTPGGDGHYLNYGFDRLRLVAPVRVGSRVRGLFEIIRFHTDARGRSFVTFGSTIEVEGETKPALVAEWLTAYIPAEQETSPPASRTEASRS